jgi:hypothetical protein
MRSSPLPDNVPAALFCAEFARQQADTKKIAVLSVCGQHRCWHRMRGRETILAAWIGCMDWFLLRA